MVVCFVFVDVVAATARGLVILSSVDVHVSVPLGCSRRASPCSLPRPSEPIGSSSSWGLLCALYCDVGVTPIGETCDGSVTKTDVRPDRPQPVSSVVK